MKPQLVGEEGDEFANELLGKVETMRSKLDSLEMRQSFAETNGLQHAELAKQISKMSS